MASAFTQLTILLLCLCACVCPSFIIIYVAYFAYVFVCVHACVHVHACGCSVCPSVEPWGWCGVFLDHSLPSLHRLGLFLNLVLTATVSLAAQLLRPHCLCFLSAGIKGADTPTWLLLGSEDQNLDLHTSTASTLSGNHLPSPSPASYPETWVSI